MGVSVDMLVMPRPQQDLGITGLQMVGPYSKMIQQRSSGPAKPHQLSAPKWMCLTNIIIYVGVSSIGIASMELFVRLSRSPYCFNQR